MIPGHPAYRSNPEETKELPRQVEEVVAKGRIREGMSPYLLARKKDGSRRMCCDSRAMNEVTVKHRHPIPRLDDMLYDLHCAVVFSQIDPKSGYHRIRTHVGD